MTNKITKVLTSKEVMREYRMSKYTLLNWRRGFYFARGKKTWFFDDHSYLEAEWNEELRRLEYKPVKVAVWVNRVKRKKGVKSNG